MSEIKLKPCPFCGADAILYFTPYVSSQPLYSIECSRCSAQIGRSKETYQASKGELHFTSEDEAAEAWNRRAERHGYWKQATPFVDTIECSKCGYQWPEPEFASNYCPNCGAKMDEEASG